MTPETLSGLIGFVLPPFIDVVNTRVSNTKLRFILSLLVSLLVGLVTVAVIDGLDFSNPGSILLSGASAFTTAQITYKQYYEKSTLRTEIKSNLNSNN
jgi:hypothetical protein